eukprot:9476050-Pyramimonas_sp.AAC.1
MEGLPVARRSPTDAIPFDVECPAELQWNVRKALTCPPACEARALAFRRTFRCPPRSSGRRGRPRASRGARSEEE